jgi:metallo-beta-lactamase family protein
MEESVEVIKGVFLDYGRVGHILGAGSVQLSFQRNGQKRTLMDSGDLGRYDRPILKDPEPAGTADWLLIESTYGNLLHPKESEAELRKVIKETAEQRGLSFDSGICHRQNTGFGVYDSKNGRRGRDPADACLCRQSHGDRSDRDLFAPYRRARF